MLQLSDQDLNTIRTAVNKAVELVIQLDQEPAVDIEIYYDLHEGWIDIRFEASQPAFFEVAHSTSGATVIFTQRQDVSALLRGLAGTLAA